MVHNESEIRTSKGVVTRCHLDAVDSTNSYAMQLLRSKPEMFSKGQGVLVVADKQSEGRGQRGNVWSNSVGKDLAMSLIVSRPPKVGATVFNMAAALATRAGIIRLIEEAGGKKIPGVATVVKWPNDVMVWSNGGYRKVAGILVENHWRGGDWTASVVGVGVNVESSRLAKPYNAASILDAFSVNVEIEKLEFRIVEELMIYLDILKMPGGEARVVSQFNEDFLGKGEHREFLRKGEHAQGVLERINKNGKGVFTWDDNGEESLDSSEVVWKYS